MLLHDDIADFEKPDGISLSAFVVDGLSRFLLHPSIFSANHLRSP